MGRTRLVNALIAATENLLNADEHDVEEFERIVARLTTFVILIDERISLLE